MKKITIAHLYYDFLNLYGENGNIKALEQILKSQNINVEIKNISLEDDIILKNIDIIYIGSGTEQNRDIALNHLLKYKKEIIDFLNNNKLIIATGNAYPLFGKKIINANNELTEALNIFNFQEQQTDRIVKEIASNNKIIKEKIYGFQNHYHQVINNKCWIENEGHHEKNFYGTYTIGPILIRNPKLLNAIIKNYLIKINPKFKWKKPDQKLEEQAYQQFITFKETKLHIK